MNHAVTIPNLLKPFPRAHVAHLPTPLEKLENLGRHLGIELYVKRDDCTGIGFGGNKVRQLEFYIGAALAAKADTVLITGAVQSNFVRTAAAMARRFGLECHIQLEERVEGVDDLYRNNGNVLLDRLLGATMHSFPVGEDELAADRKLAEIAAELRQEGRKTFIIPLAPNHPPTGALGYVDAAHELSQQLDNKQDFDEIVVASGSALTHVGLLYGLRVIANKTPVQGICVRRNAEEQTARVKKRTQDLCKLTTVTPDYEDGDFKLYDGSLAPGYGKLNPDVIDAIRQAAHCEGMFVDPAYTGKVLAGLIQLVRANKLAGKRILFWHTGGQPALFAYSDQLQQAMET